MSTWDSFGGPDYSGVPPFEREIIYFTRIPWLEGSDYSAANIS